VKTFAAIGAALSELSDFRAKVEAEMGRVSKLGNWPAWVDVNRSLLGRVPSSLDEKAPGFDAGIACCLDLIPREKQGLSARLHAAWSEADVLQLRKDFENFPGLDSAIENGLNPDAESTWWLAGCAICDEEGGVSGAEFVAQVADFRDSTPDVPSRLRLAAGALFDMLEGFDTELHYPEIPGVAFANRDGGMQAAYVAGHEIAVHFMDGIYFVGTFRPSLGLEGFEWGKGVDAMNRPTSGPVHGSKQFVKAADQAEMIRVVKTAQKYLAAQK